MKQIIIALAMMAPFMAQADEAMPTKVGQCAVTQIAKIGTRLVDGRTNQPVEGSGSAILFTNGGAQVSYDTIEAISIDSRAGDRVLICLVFIPQDCPPGDDRGKIYTTTNLKTLGSWTLGETQHGCGGA